VRSRSSLVHHRPGDAYWPLSNQNVLILTSALRGHAARPQPAQPRRPITGSLPPSSVGIISGRLRYAPCPLFQTSRPIRTGEKEGRKRRKRFAAFAHMLARRLDRNSRKSTNRRPRLEIPEIGGFGYLTKVEPTIPEIRASRKPVGGQAAPPAVPKIGAIVKNPSRLFSISVPQDSKPNCALRI
jgi:hypothetical protein